MKKYHKLLIWNTIEGKTCHKHKIIDQNEDMVTWLTTYLQKKTTTFSFSERIFSNILVLTSSIRPGISKVSSSVSQERTSSSSSISPIKLKKKHI